MKFPPITTIALVICLLAALPTFYVVATHAAEKNSSAKLRHVPFPYPRPKFKLVFVEVIYSDRPRVDVLRNDDMRRQFILSFETIHADREVADLEPFVDYQGDQWTMGFLVTYTDRR